MADQVETVQVQRKITQVVMNYRVDLSASMEEALERPSRVSFGFDASSTSPFEVCPNLANRILVTPIFQREPRAPVEQDRVEWHVLLKNWWPFVFDPSGDLGHNGDEEHIHSFARKWPNYLALNSDYLEHCDDDDYVLQPGQLYRQPREIVFQPSGEHTPATVASVADYSFWVDFDEPFQARAEFEELILQEQYQHYHDLLGRREHQDDLPELEGSEPNCYLVL